MSSVIRRRFYKWLQSNDLTPENVDAIRELVDEEKEKELSDFLAHSIVSDAISPPLTGTELQEWMQEQIKGERNMSYALGFTKDDRPDYLIFHSSHGKRAFSKRAQLFDALYDMGIWEIRSLKTHDQKRLRTMQGAISHISKDLGWRDNRNNPLYRTAINVSEEDGQKVFVLSVQRLPVNWEKEIEQRYKIHLK